jgi:exopolysaccharide biosynthesis predicted pyruvyltransferase EpsI
MHNRIPQPKLRSLPFQEKDSNLLQNCIAETTKKKNAIPFNASKGYKDMCLSKRVAERRKKRFFASKYTLRATFTFVFASIGCGYIFFQQIYLRIRYKTPIWNHKISPIKLIKSSMSPFDSHPPKVESLNITSNIRHACLQEIRNHRHSFFVPYIESATHILLVDPAYHSNVGDHMITIAELVLQKSHSREATTLSQCSYVQAHNFVPNCDDVLQKEAIIPNLIQNVHAESFPSAVSLSTDRRQLHPYKVALWHGGGNFGNLWASAQQARLRSIVLLLQANFTIIGMPNSWYYTNSEIEAKDTQQLRHNIIVGLGMDSRQQETITDVQLSSLAKSRIIWTWREHYSYDRAIKLLPYCTHQLVPDIAFQLGPYRPFRPSLIPDAVPGNKDHLPTSSGAATNELDAVDIVFLLRNDHESLFAPVRNRLSMQRILDSIPGASHLSFSIVDWNDRLSRFQSNNPTDIYFTESAIQLLSIGTVLICDRLHAAILAYISDISFIYLDQISGKIHKSFTVAMESGPNCMQSIISSNYLNATTIHNAAKFWSHAGTLPNAIKMAVQIVQQHIPVDSLLSYGRNRRSIIREQRRNQIRQKIINA